MIQVICGLSFTPWRTGQAVTSTDDLACRPRVKRELTSGQIPGKETTGRMTQTQVVFRRPEFSQVKTHQDAVPSLAPCCTTSQE